VVTDDFVWTNSDIRHVAPYQKDYKRLYCGGRRYSR